MRDGGSLAHILAESQESSELRLSSSQVNQSNSRPRTLQNIHGYDIGFEFVARMEHAKILAKHC